MKKNIIYQWLILIICQAVWFSGCSTSTNTQEATIAPKIGHVDTAVVQAPSSPTVPVNAIVAEEKFTYAVAPQLSISHVGKPQVHHSGVIKDARKMAGSGRDMYSPIPHRMPMIQIQNNEKYIKTIDNPIKTTKQDPVSTISFDVDTGSYSNIRRFLNSGTMPPKDAVRVEEMINYFPYPSFAMSKMQKHPFVTYSEVTQAPWNDQHWLLQVAIKAQEQDAKALPPSNLVFLVDVSGSMNESNKLPLVQSSLRLLTEQLRPEDKVSLVVYAGRSSVELPPTSGAKKDQIIAAINRLQAGGSTAGESALKMAYEQAREGFIKGGINRILLATDGDFNVGVSSVEEMKKIIEKERKSGVSLSTLGYGTGNYQEAMMEQIADVGNGNYSYIDSLAEAHKVLVQELSSTFHTVAKDVKMQIEFNPAVVQEWRLIGYENRVLREEDFTNDAVDAGEVGAGKVVVALYELTPVGAKSSKPERRYQSQLVESVAEERNIDELGFLKIRYKKPDGERSIELSQALAAPEGKLDIATASQNLRFAVSVAAFGQLLREQDATQQYSYQQARALAKSALPAQATNIYTELLTLIDLAQSLATKNTTN